MGIMYKTNNHSLEHRIFERRGGHKLDRDLNAA